MAESSKKSPIDLTPEELQKEIEKEAENVFRHTAIDFLTKNIPEYDISDTYVLKNPQVDPLSLAEGLITKTPPQITLKPVLNPETGEIIDYKEIFHDESLQEGDARTSMSLKRAPDPKSLDKVRGSTSNIPFMPGGFDDELEEIFRFSDWQETKTEEEEKYLNFEEVLKTPQGFEKPIVFTESDLKQLGTASLKELPKMPKLEKFDNEIVQPQNDQTSIVADDDLHPALDMNTADIFSIINFVTSSAPVIPMEKESETTAAVVENLNIIYDGVLLDAEIEKLDQDMKNQVAQKPGSTPLNRTRGTIDHFCFNR